jgi:hypothetical protein
MTKEREPETAVVLAFVRKAKAPAPAEPQREAGIVESDGTIRTVKTVSMVMTYTPARS